MFKRITEFLMDWVLAFPLKVTEDNPHKIVRILGILAMFPWAVFVWIPMFPLVVLSLFLMVLETA